MARWQWLGEEQVVGWMGASRLGKGGRPGELSGGTRREEKGVFLRPPSSRTKIHLEARFLKSEPNPHPQVISRMCLSRSVTEFILIVYSKESNMTE